MNTAINTSGINPTGAMVLVKYDAPKAKTASGLHLPSAYAERESKACQVGVLVAKGPVAGKFDDGAEFPPEGSRVVVKKYADQYDMRGDDGSEYRLCEDRDILAVLEGL